MTINKHLNDLGWFGAGYTVAKGGTDDGDIYPPLNDLEAQREWFSRFLVKAGAVPGP